MVWSRLISVRGTILLIPPACPADFSVSHYGAMPDEPAEFGCEGACRHVAKSRTNRGASPRDSTVGWSPCVVGSRTIRRASRRDSSVVGSRTIRRASRRDSKAKAFGKWQRRAHWADQSCLPRPARSATSLWKLATIGEPTHRLAANQGVHPSGGSARNQNGESLGRRRVTPVVHGFNE